MNEVEEQSQESMPMHPYTLNNPMQSFGGSILYLTNPDQELRKLEMTLRNEVEDKEGNVIVLGKPLLNEEGQRSVLGLVQACVNQVTVMSSLKEDEVENIGDFLGDTLARDLMINRVHYEITNASARDRIYFASLATARITMNRGRNESDKRFWKGSQQEITTRVESERQRGGFSLFPFGRRN